MDETSFAETIEMIFHVSLWQIEERASPVIDLDEHSS